MNLYPQRAFTLVELMITLALLAILASVAVPAFSELIARNRQLALQEEMLAALNYTRAQAVLSNSSIELCASGNGTSCQNNWTQGWIIRKTSSGELLRTSQQAAGTSLRWHGFRQHIRFAGNGIGFAANGSFFECDQQKLAWLVVLNRQGRARIGNAADKHERLHLCGAQEEVTDDIETAES